MTIWRAGMKAVCVEAFVKAAEMDFGRRLPLPSGLPNVGSVYEVSDVDVDYFDNEVVLCLVGFDNYFCFDAHHFRPVVSKPTSIEVFQKICDDVSRRQPATVA